MVNQKRARGKSTKIQVKEGWKKILFSIFRQSFQILPVQFYKNQSIQEMAFRLCTKQSVDGKSQEDKQLENLHHDWINLPSGN